MKTAALTLVSMLIGTVSVLLIPSEFVLAPILVPFAFCIALGWYLAFQNKAVQLTPFRVFFWPWVNLTASLRKSRAMQAFCVAAGLAVGGCLALIIRTTNA
jgi:hypothetical protein